MAFLRYLRFFILSIFIFLPTFAMAACPDTMTSYWKLDGELNEPYMNEIDSTYNGVCIGAGACPSATTDGMVGEGAQVFERFDKTTGTGINIPPSSTSSAPFDWEATDSFTIEVWVKRPLGSGIPGTEVIVGREFATGSVNWWIGINQATGVAAFRLRDTANQGPATITGTTNLTDGEWHHIMAVRDAAQNKNLLYVDGVLEGSADFEYNPANSFKSSTASLTIGWLNSSPFYFVNGVIDEVALYNVALPARIAERHYVLGKPYCEVFAPGVFRNGAWFLDSNNNGVADTADIIRPLGSFGYPDGIPVVGDWNGDGNTNIGQFRRGVWYFDMDGSYSWTGGDKIVPFGSFGYPDGIPITGDWNGDGITNIGQFRRGVWYFDMDHNFTWNAGDMIVPFGKFGYADGIPITGDWNGDGKTSIGQFRRGVWYFDMDHNFTWNAGDKIIPFGQFGYPDGIPVTGDWNGDGITNIGQFRKGVWYLDYNGNGKWDAGDKIIQAGSFWLSNDIPTTGVWPIQSGTN